MINRESLGLSNNGISLPYVAFYDRAVIGPKTSEPISEMGQPKDMHLISVRAHKKHRERTDHLSGEQRQAATALLVLPSIRCKIRLEKTLSIIKIELEYNNKSVVYFSYPQP